MKQDHPYSILLLSLAVLPLQLGGCATHAYSPPSRIHNLSSPRALGDGNVSAGVFGGAHVSIFTFDAISIGGDVGYGVSDEIPLSFDGTLSEIGNGDQATIHPYLTSGRAELKFTPEEGNQHVAFRLGAGGGTSWRLVF